MVKRPNAITLALFSLTLISSPLLAAENASSDSESLTATATKKIDNSIKDVGNFMDDSTLTARVKAALIDNKQVTSADISVKTENKAVTLTGFVGSQKEAEQAVAAAKKVEGVSSVSDKLHVRDESHSSFSGFADDAAITSEVKAKFLADDGVPSRHISVKTTEGIVLLTGNVNSQAQSEQAESLAKKVEGVKSVKNDLSVK